MRSRTVERLSSTFCIMIRGIHQSGHMFFMSHIGSYCNGFLVLSKQPAQVSKDLTMKEVLSRTRNDSSAAAKCLDHRQLEISREIPTGWWFHLMGCWITVWGQHSRNSIQKDAGSSRWSLRLFLSSFSKNWEMFSCLWLKGLLVMNLN